MPRYHKKPHVIPIIISTIVILLVLSGVFYAFGGFGNKKTLHNPSTTPSTITPPKQKKSKTTQLDNLINKTFALAKEGKMIKAPYVSGKTKLESVKSLWGNPSQETKFESSIYDEFSNYHVVVGSKYQTIFDLRSSNPDLQQVRLGEIKKVLGKADEVRYFKDKNNNQIILVYHVSPKYDLKWILPNPTDQNPNPKVDHISVYYKLAIKPKTSDVIASMSLDEKIGQMIIAGVYGTSMDSATRNLIHKYKVGGIIFYSNNLVSPEQTVQFLNQIKAESPQVPLLLCVDQEGGRISRLPGLVKIPTNQVIGQKNDAHFSYQIGTMLGRELKEFGFNLDFAPVLDVNSNPKNPVIGDRSFGSNAEIVSKLGVQTMRGIQSERIIPTIKHFPGHGDTSVDSHLELPIVYKSLDDLEKLELIPFSRAINNGADVVMVAHILLPKLDKVYPSSMSEKVVTGLLRKQLHFNGVVMTDDMTMKAITNHFNITKAAVDSVKAGCDIILVAHDYDKVVATIHALKVAVQNGDISENRINESVTRILNLKKEYEIDNTKVQEFHLHTLNQSLNKLLHP